MTFNMDDYIDVPARIALFAAKYPEGSLQGDGYFVRDVEEKIVGYHYVARAYRTADDGRPGVGTAFEPIPGKTPYTRDSEVMNAETSAWGRAIVALGFETKKIASREEVRARQSPEGGNGSQAAPSPVASSAGMDSGSPSEPFTPPADVRAKLAENAGRIIPQDGGVPEEVVMPFGKHSGRKLGDLLNDDLGYVKWVAGKMDAKTADQRRVKGAAITLLGGKPEPVAAAVGPDDDIPFQRTI